MAFAEKLHEPGRDRFPQLFRLDHDPKEVLASFEGVPFVKEGIAFATTSVCSRLVEQASNWMDEASNV